MRKAEPRYYTARRQWYVMHKGKRHVLVRLGPGETMQKTRARALEAYADLVSRLKAEGVWEVGPGDRISVATMGARYLAAMEASLAPATLRQYGIAVRDVAGPPAAGAGGRPEPGRRRAGQRSERCCRHERTPECSFPHATKCEESGYKDASISVRSTKRGMLPD